MNKKIISFLLVLFLASSFISANDWGILDEYRGDVNNFGMLKFLNGKEITYHLSATQLSSQSTYTPEERLELALEYKHFIQKAFDTWPIETKKIILNEPKRKDEFKDITSKYLKSVKIKEVKDKNEADLIINFTTIEGKSARCGKVPAGCYSTTEHLMTIPDPFLFDSEKERNAQLSTFIHEIGHFFGLADQYKNLNDIDPVYSDFDKLGVQSVMGSNYDFIHLRCDDADGFINLIDLTLAIKNNGVFSKRAQEGWASLCNGKTNRKDNFYREGKTLDKQPFRVTWNCLYEYDSKGNISKILCPTPFNFYNKKLEYNNSNLIEYATDSDFQCSYSYSKKKKEIVISCNGEKLIADGCNSQKKELNGKEVWTLPDIYNIKAYPAEGYVYIDRDVCHINNYIPSTDFKAYNLVFTNNKLEDKFSYIVLTDSVRPIPIVINRNLATVNSVYTAKLCDKKILKEFGVKNCINVFENDDITQEIADYAAMSYDDFVEQIQSVAMEDLSSFVINNAKALCKHYNNVEEVFK